MKPRILHLSADYPDRFQPAKTRAIAGLVEGTADHFDHLVVSLNRQGGSIGTLQPGRVLASDKAGAVIALQYAGPPAAIAIAKPMARLADWLADELAQIGFKPDLIQAHKLTIEGVMAQRLAARLGVPFALTLQGNTDQKLLRLRPDRLPMLRQVWREARAIMAFAPWTADWCTARLGEPQAPVCINPCLLPYDDVLAPVIRPPLIRTAFNLDSWRNKNVVTLFEAIARLKWRLPEVRLEIAGVGSQAAAQQVTAQTAYLGLTEAVSLIGPVSPENIQTWFNGAAVFALPSLRESFGMVFTEALLAGTPVIYPRGAAIDGFIPDKAFARAVTAVDAGELAEVLYATLVDQGQIKAALAAAQNRGELELFRRQPVLNRFAEFLTGGLT
jgi:glycosyltransferase involved in cell wall biosynthesis